MTKKREKRQVLSGITRQQMEEAMNDYARLDAQMDRLQATIDLKVAQVRERHSEEMLSLAARREQAMDILMTWAEENKEHVFDRRKSLELPNGTIGYRTGTPKLKTLKGFTWEAVLSLVRLHCPDYIRTTEAVAKDRLLADREADGMSEKMKAVGICVVQDETFFVEPRKTEQGE